jgi:hypothetical protein
MANTRTPLSRKLIGTRYYTPDPARRERVPIVPRDMPGHRVGASVDLILDPGPRNVEIGLGGISAGDYFIHAIIGGTATS